MMRRTLRTMGLASMLAIGALAVWQTTAHAGCGGGRAVRSGRGAYATTASCCGTNMAGMNMGGYAAPTTTTTAPATRGYTCPMHPGVVSASPASCPYCGMALAPR